MSASSMRRVSAVAARHVVLSPACHQAVLALFQNLECTSIIVFVMVRGDVCALVPSVRSSRSRLRKRLVRALEQLLPQATRALFHTRMITLLASCLGRSVVKHVPRKRAHAARLSAVVVGGAESTAPRSYVSGTLLVAEVTSGASLCCGDRVKRRVHKRCCPALHGLRFGGFPEVPSCIGLAESLNQYRNIQFILERDWQMVCTGRTGSHYWCWAIFLACLARTADP